MEGLQEGPNAFICLIRGARSMESDRWNYRFNIMDGTFRSGTMEFNGERFDLPIIIDPVEKGELNVISMLLCASNAPGSGKISTGLAGHRSSEPKIMCTSFVGALIGV